jgi:hypothetical protein
MGKRAKAGTCVETLVKMALPLFRQAEAQCPRTGPGAKPEIPDWLMAALIMVAILLKKKSKSSQYRCLCQRRAALAEWLGDARFPSRATYFRRYRRAHRFYQHAIRLQGEQAIADGVTDARTVAVDKSLLEALGPPGHSKDRQQGRLAPGVDADASWGYSEHHGWVHGFSFEVVVTATPGTTVFPLLASADTASVSEARNFRGKIADLHASTVLVCADSGFDANYLGEAIEYDEHGQRTGRRFLCPENPRNNKRRKTKRGAADASRARSRELRRQRREFLESPKGRRAYAQRKKTVEPFNQWLKSLFELDRRVWHRGLENNRTQLLAAIFAYQLLVRYNHRCGNPNGRLCWILDAL